MSKKPLIVVQKQGQRMNPATPADAELLDEFANGKQFSLMPVGGRSWPQLKLYWMFLGRVIKATGLYPTKEHLHRELLIQCGFYTRVVSLSGGIRFDPDSAAFDKMAHEDFCTYFNEAIAAMASHGIEFDAVMERQPA